MATKASPIYLCGPTASGKSSLAITLAEKLDGEIVNADAFQTYRGLECLAATPEPVDQERVPHHLYSIFPLTESLDAARYEKIARPVIDDIINRNRQPIIVGGSGLYLKFLTHGPSPAPKGDPELREKLDALPLDEIFAQLKALDPEEAARQNPQNRRHLTRSLEICLLSGEKASDIRSNFNNPKHEATLNGFLLDWPRDQLRERIARRTEIILASGAISEVENLPENATTARQAIGIKEIEAHLDQELSLAECTEKLTTSTRQYAKRQGTWFRREKWLTPLDATSDPATLTQKVTANLHIC